MKTLDIILTILVALVVIQTELFSQQEQSFDVVVYLTRGISRIEHTEQAMIETAQIRETLQKYNITERDVISAFPEFIESDTLKSTEDEHLIGQPNYAKMFRITTPNEGIQKALIEELNKMPDVLFAEPGAVADFLVIPNDQHFGRQWNMHNTGQYGGTPGADIKGPSAWDIYTGSVQRKIGIIDSGVEASHPDLSGKVTGDGPTGSHGTHVAGISAAKTNNNQTGVAGVDWNARIISKNISNQNESGINAKIRSAVDEGADVLNNSWRLIDQSGNPVYSTIVRLAFAYAYKYNRVAAVAIGNQYQEGNPTNYPAAFGP